MKRHILRFGFTVIISGIFSLFSVDFAPSVFNTLYTVIGIFFSIGYSIVIGFDLSSVTDESVLLRIRQRLKSVEQTFIGYFVVATLAFFLADQRPCPFRIGAYSFSWEILAVFTSLYIILHQVVNFTILQKMKENLIDHLRVVKKETE